MTDWRAAWEASQVATGRQALEMLAGGVKWREIADRLHAGDIDTAQRAAALALAADLAARREAQA